MTNQTNAYINDPNEASIDMDPSTIIVVLGLSHAATEEGIQRSNTRVKQERNRSKTAARLCFLFPLAHWW